MVCATQLFYILPVVKVFFALFKFIRADKLSILFLLVF